MKKVAIFEMDSDGRKECINEANILQALPSHPHIIKYKHSYLYDNDLYLILELAEGGDISLLLEQQRKKGSYFQEAEIWSATPKLQARFEMFARGRQTRAEGAPVPESSPILVLHLLSVIPRVTPQALFRSDC